MDKFIKDRIIRTVGNSIRSCTIYIQSVNIQYINYIVSLLHKSGLYSIVINNTNITRINNGDIIIAHNIPPPEAAIYSIIAENNKGLFIYIHNNESYCNIICDMITDIEKKCKEDFNKTSLEHPECIVKMISGYVVTNIMKYIYNIGKLGNFKWSDTISTNITESINKQEPQFYKYINKFKGSIQSILPHITSKDIIIKTNEKTYQICTIENKPTMIEHIVEWVRDKINLNDSRHDRFMILFNENIRQVQEIFPNVRIMEPIGELYEEFIKVDNINDYILTAVKIRAYNYNIIIPTNETIIDMYNRIEPTIPSMISFVDGLCEIEMIKFRHSSNNKFYTWDIDMIENKIIRNDIVPAKEVEINGVIYNEWHTFTYNNIDTTLEDMIIDMNIMYGTFIEMILYNNIIIYNDMNININTMDINIKTLFMDRFNIDIMKESITLQLIGMNDVLLPLKIEPPN
jgi:hypothetical protein